MKSDSQLNEESVKNLRNHVFYHGTRPENVLPIMQQGFTTWREGGADYESFYVPGAFGTGTYITCNWRTALWFGTALLQVALRPGTRILDVPKLPDPSVIRHLQREFGREILTADPRKMLPHNKQLTLAEVIALFRYHFEEREKYWRRYVDDRPRRKPRGFRVNTSHLRSLLIRYGFHGFGNPDDENGIVIFSPDRVVPKELVVTIPETPWNKLGKEVTASSCSLEELRQRFPK
jgi:hypothetical protein